MPKQIPQPNQSGTRVPQVSRLSPGSELTKSDKPPSRRSQSRSESPATPATLPELIRFIIDRTGYIKALEAEGIARGLQPD